MKPEGKEEKPTFHDFFEDNKTLLRVGGFLASKRTSYTVYRIAQLVFHLYTQALCFVGMYMGAPRTELVLGAFHVQLISTFAVWGLIARHLTDSSLTKTRNLFVTGIYNYEDEEPDPEIIRLREGIQVEITKKSNLLFLAFFIGGTCNLVYYPVSQLLFLSQEQVDSYDLANPYIAHFYYYPVSTRTAWGFAFVYASNVVLLLFIYGTACCMNAVYISITVQMKVHLQILNVSIRKLHQRAYLRLLRAKTGSRVERQALSQDEAFRYQLFMCLRSNIQHHHALLRVYKWSKPYNGSCLLEIIVLASIIYASVVYCMYQKPPVHIIINYIVTLLSEMLYAFYMCLFGEEIIEESSKLFESLYSVSWMDYDKRFTQTLRIMMSNTKEPIKIKALLLSFATSLETFSDLISAMYKLMNVWRQSERKK